MSSARKACLVPTAFAASPAQSSVGLTCLAPQRRKCHFRATPSSPRPRHVVRIPHNLVPVGQGLLLLLENSQPRVHDSSNVQNQAQESASSSRPSRHLRPRGRQEFHRLVTQQQNVSRHPLPASAVAATRTRCLPSDVPASGRAHRHSRQHMGLYRLFHLHHFPVCFSLSCHIKIRSWADGLRGIGQSLYHIKVASCDFYQQQSRTGKSILL